jgi:hypothetical protein
LLDKEDFARMLILPSWYYSLDKYGEGQALEFPIWAKSALKRSPKHYLLNDAGVLVQAPVYIFQVVKLYITKTPCSIDSLK